ncbi:unnamed protein product, partial [Vitis vinifera]
MKINLFCEKEKVIVISMLNWFKVSYPIVSDPKSDIILLLNMVDPAIDSYGNNLPSRVLYIIGPDKKIKLGFLYPGSTGRNVDEVMRVLDALQKAAKHRIATPVNWKPGELVVIQPGVSDDEAKQLFPQGFQTVALPSNNFPSDSSGLPALLPCLWIDYPWIFQVLFA